MSISLQLNKFYLLGKLIHFPLNRFPLQDLRWARD